VGGRKEEKRSYEESGEGERDPKTDLKGGTRKLGKNPQ